MIRGYRFTDGVHIIVMGIATKTHHIRAIRIVQCKTHVISFATLKSETLSIRIAAILSKVKMDPNTKHEIRKKLLNSRFYKPLKNCIPNESNFTVYSFSGNEDFVQPIFKPSSNGAVGGQASTSAVMNPPNNFAPRNPPPKRRTIFEITKVHDGLRLCQLCDRSYKTKRHGNRFKKQHICCVCRKPFNDEAALVEHVDKTIKAKVCCFCQMALHDDPEKNIAHFKRHVGTKGKQFSIFSTW